MKSFVNIFLISSICVGILFMIFTTFSKKGKDKPIIYLNLLILSITLNYTQIVVLDNFFSYSSYFTQTLRIPFYAFILPAFYTFITFYLNVERKIKSFVLLSTLLFVIEVLFRIILYKQYNDDYVVISTYRQFEEVINILFSIFIFIKAILLLFNRSKLYENILTFDNIKWLKKFMFIATLIMVTWIVALLINLNKIHPLVYVYYPLRISVSVLIFWLGYQGFTNYNLMAERIQLRSLIAINKKTAKILSENSNPNNKFNIIKNHINSNSSFTNPCFSLEQLSNELKMSTSTVSKIINTESDYSFSDYINYLRIEKAKEYLILNEFQEYTILAIGLECGFNSKSTFYAAFKKFTSITPSQFRLQNKTNA